MSLRSVDIKRLYSWFVEEKEATMSEQLLEPRFGRLLELEPAFQSGNVAFYSPMNMVQAGFTEKMAYYYVTDLALNYTTGLRIAQLCSMVKDCRALTQSLYALLSKHGVTESFPEVQEAFQAIVDSSRPSFDAFGLANGGNQHSSPSVFILIKFHDVNAVKDFTSGKGSVQSYIDNWDDQLSSYTLSELRNRIHTSLDTKIEELAKQFEYPALAGCTQEETLWLEEKIVHLQNLTLDRNISRRTLQLEGYVRDTKRDFRVQFPSSSSLENHTLEKGLLPFFPQDLFPFSNAEELAFVREMISGTSDSEGILGDMSRARQRLREVLDSEDDHLCQAEHALFMQWFVEQKENIPSLLQKNPTPSTTKKPYLALLLTWNPEKWNDWDYDTLVEQTKAGALVPDTWTVRQESIPVGTKVFLVIQHSRKKVGGVIGMGRTTGDTYIHQEDKKRRVPVDWSVLIPIEKHISYAELKSIAPKTYFQTQSSGHVGIKNSKECEALEQEIASRTSSQKHSPIETHHEPIILEASQLKAAYPLPGDDFLEEMLFCFEENITCEELAAAIQERGNFVQKYLDSSNIKQKIKSYGFFDIEHGQIQQNHVSESYASGDLFPLTRVFLQRFYLAAELLKWISEYPGKTRSEIFTRVKHFYPKWTTYNQVRARLWWFEFLGLVSCLSKEGTNEETLILSQTGKQVLALIDFTGRECIEGEFGTFPKELLNQPYFEIKAEIQKNSELVVDETQLKMIHNGFHSNKEKRFIILSGLSGTGKTKLLQKYAEAYCHLSKIEKEKQEKHIAFVSISPAFRDHTPLLGYLNPLSSPPKYMPGMLSQFLVDAESNPDKPFFLILDEMNLARVEYYLAPFLSVMESDTPLTFYEVEEEESEDMGFPNQISGWPSNIFMAGTVNMDETTHAFSDKVLDRAFTMEFWDIDLESFLKKLSVDGVLYDTITAVYKALHPAHLHFGYRTVKAIVDYVRMAEETDSNDTIPALDQAIFSKVLPKLRGQKSTALTDALSTLGKACTNLPQCTKKIEQMELRLKDTGLTRFWR